jgi:hypothetical protein
MRGDGISRQGQADEDRSRLKAATGRQIAAAGGLEAAARRTRVGKSELSTYQSVNHPDRFMPIDVVADLMGAGSPREILEALADLAGCVVVPLDASPAGLDQDIATVGEDVALVFRDYADLVDASPCTAAHVRRLDRDLALLCRAALRARSDLKTRLGPPDPGPSARRSAG